MTRKAKNGLSKTGNVPCARCPLRKKAVMRPFTARELEFVEWFKTAELVADPGANILLEGHNSPHLYTLMEGWAFRYKTLPDARRQILSFALPGDFLGLQGPALKEMQHSVEALTQVKLCVFPRERLWHLYQKHPELGHDIVWLAARGEHMVDEHLLSVGRRTAAERIGYLLLHLLSRCRALELCGARQMQLPLTQQHVADALGLSLVHTNKSLRKLVRQGLLTWTGDILELRNEKALRELSKYDETDGQVRPLI
jgi:CRP-like cAMP-binding protein